MSDAATAQSVSHGVEALIAQLRREGVEAGAAQAQALLAAARAEAEQLRAQAQSDAARLRAEAQAEADRLARTGRDVLAAAMRDAILSLRADLMERFSADIRRLVSEALADPALIRALLLEVARGAGAAAGVQPGEPMTAHLAGPVQTVDELRQDLEAVRAAPLTQLVLASTGRILKEGVTLSHGVTLSLRDGDLVIDLTDAALADLLLRHLQPRFRALFDGIIR
jgi:V/A-type H+-transporting ATPase subunit E